MEWLATHKWWFIIPIGGYFGLKVMNSLSANTAANTAAAAAAQQAGGGTTIVSGSGLPATVTAATAAGTGTGIPDLTQLFQAQIEAAKQSSLVARTAALTSTSVDTLNQLLANVGMGQSINISYDQTGQVTSASKSSVYPGNPVDQGYLAQLNLYWTGKATWAQTLAWFDTHSEADKQRIRDLANQYRPAGFVPGR